jgi:hypothetical protein
VNKNSPFAIAITDHAQLTGEIQKQHYRIAIASHRTRTDSALGDQILGEELLN